MSTLLEQVDGLLQANRPVCFTALVETRGSTPQKPGATMLVFHDGTQLGTLGGGCVEAEVKRRALELLYIDRQDRDDPVEFAGRCRAEIPSRTDATLR